MTSKLAAWLAAALLSGGAAVAAMSKDALAAYIQGLINQYHQIYGYDPSGTAAVATPELPSGVLFAIGALPVAVAVALFARRRRVLGDGPN